MEEDLYRLTGGVTSFPTVAFCFLDVPTVSRRPSVLSFTVTVATSREPTGYVMAFPSSLTVTRFTFREMDSFADQLPRSVFVS